LLIAWPPSTWCRWRSTAIQAELKIWPEPFGDPGGYDNFFEWLNASWVYMDIGTILAGIVALRFLPVPVHRRDHGGGGSGSSPWI